MRILICVQHLLGIGHLQRALQLAGGLAQADFRVDLVSGGMPNALRVPSGVCLHQLPPLRCADGNFDRLLDETGNEIDTDWQDRRKRQLLELYATVLPDALITETFPFGRRMLRFEMLPLLEAARASRTCRVVVASIRDILQPKSKAGRNEEIVDLVRHFYDHVLIHGDARLAPLEASFSLAAAVADRVSYSGYVCRDAPAPAASSNIRNEIIVSAGGSVTGLRLLQTAIEARASSSLAKAPWRLRVSPSIDAADFAALRARAGSGVIVERNQGDLQARLQQARLSISQAGYNTVCEILSSSTPAVLVPYAEADEMEQSIRAAILHRRQRVVALAETELGPQSLAAAIDQALKLDTRLEVDLDGVRQSVRLMRSWLDEAATCA